MTQCILKTISNGIARRIAVIIVLPMVIALMLVIAVVMGLIGAVKEFAVQFMEVCEHLKDVLETIFESWRL
jgi:hypothetical protein